jgi:methionyl-tRNA synthetase
MIRLRVFTTLYEKGDFIEQVTEQLYDAKADQFLADRFVMDLPKMWQRRSMATNVKNVVQRLNATDLINPKSTITGNPIMKSTKHWFYL